MTFNARWAFEQLSQKRGRPALELLLELQADFQEMVETCPTYRADLQPNGNCFRLQARDGSVHTPDPVAGLYTFFTRDAVIYFGEATNLRRRQLVDPDNTADSGKVFTNQGRAVLKLLLHRGWTARLDLTPLIIQLYPADVRLQQRTGQTFEEYYQVTRFSKALEGALTLFVPRYHPKMIARAKSDGLIDD